MWAFYFPAIDLRKFYSEENNLIRPVFLLLTLSLILILSTVSCTNGTVPESPKLASPAPTPIPIPTKFYSQTMPATPLPAPTPLVSAEEITSPINENVGKVVHDTLPVEKPSEKIFVKFPLTILDREEKPLTFTEPPERIVVYDAAAVETIFAIGQGHRIIGTHSWVSYPEESEKIEKVGDAFNMDIERIVALDPDLVFLFYPTFKQELEKAGLKVLLLESVDDDLRKMANTFRIWGQITNAPNEAELLAKDFENRVMQIESILAPYDSGPSVFQDVGDLWTPGDNTLMGSVFNLLKLKNISHDVANYGQLSPEVIIDRKPQILISSNPDSIYQNPAFQELLPVKNNSIFKSNDDYLSISGPRFILGVEELALEFYPGIFK
jgi:iron complex transport system substrate-binding protein